MINTDCQQIVKIFSVCYNKQDKSVIKYVYY